MKKFLWVILTVLLVVSTGRAEEDVALNWSHTIVAADTGTGSGTNRDTVLTRAIDMLLEFPSATRSIWSRIDLYDKDTVLLNDSVLVFWQFSVDGATWANFDSLKVNTTSVNDTTLRETTRILLDSNSVAATSRWLRVGLAVDYDVAAADSGIIGNSYVQKHTLWLFPKY
jgi:hypothetical protein